MRNAMRTIVRIYFFGFLLVVTAGAQNRLRTEPAPAATGPDYDVSFGYTNFAMAIPGAGRVNLNGLDMSGTIDFNPRWGTTIDSTYVRTSDVLGTPHSGYVLTFLGGPVFYPVERRNIRVFVHTLAGRGVVDGAATLNGTNYRYGWSERFAYAIGGGVESSLPGPFSVRVGGDYLHTSFFDFAGAVLPQNNFRATVSLVFHLNQRQHRVVLR